MCPIIYVLTILCLTLGSSILEIDMITRVDAGWEEFNTTGGRGGGG